MTSAKRDRLSLIAVLCLCNYNVALCSPGKHFYLYIDIKYHFYIDIKYLSVLPYGRICTILL